MTWYNEKTNIDMALSFQHQEGANLLWYLTIFHSVLNYTRKIVIEYQTGENVSINPWIDKTIEDTHRDKSIDFDESSENDYYMGDIGLCVPDNKNLDKFEASILVCV